MKALRFARSGDLKHLELAECPKPVPAGGEVLVEIRAGGLNQSDVSNVLGKHPYTTLPRTPGRDFAGVVVEGPRELAGKAVWGTGKEFGFTRDGSHAQYLAAPAAALAEKPSSLSFAQAASCGVPYTTAWSALERSGVTAGTRLVIVGAAGGVGSAALALARWRGAQVAAAVRRPEQAAVLAEQGVPTLLLDGQSILAESTARIFPGGADVVFDTSGACLAESIAAIANYGRVVVIVAPPEGKVVVPVRELYRRAGSVVGVNSLLFSGAECARMLEPIGRAFDAGELPAPAAPRERALASGTEVYAELGSARRAKYVLVS